MLRTSDHEHRIVVGITQGDINGIGYEVIIKSCLDQRILDLYVPVVYGSSKAASYHRKTLNIPDFNFHVIRHADQATPKRPNLLNLHDKEIKIEMGISTAVAGEQSLAALNAAIDDLKKGHIDVLVTAPVNKKNVQESGEKDFTGHTGYIAKKLGVTDYLMLMVSNQLKIGMVTEHIPIAEVATAINEEIILKKLGILESSLKQDFGIRKPRIAVLGLNPHAGDTGLLGDEEQKIITPAIEKAVTQGMIVSGPFAADGFFASVQYKHFDAILAMYHDQGLIPFKTLSFEEGVNYTAGLPYIRTSPVHGTAYDIAGKDLASADSMRAAIYLACDIFRNRKEWDELNKNPLGIGVFEKEN